jgi:hypothetical protein
MQPKPTGHFHTETLSQTPIPEHTSEFIIPAYGYLYELRIQPKELLPNLDANNPLRLHVFLRHWDGSLIPVTVKAICEKVES